MRNLARRRKEDLKFKKVNFEKGGRTYESTWKGFGMKALKFEIYLTYDDLVDNKDKDGSLEQEIWERLNDEYSNR